MDAADLATRAQLLTGPLRSRLERTWPQLNPSLDVGAARERPGAPIGVRWTDGPTVEQVRSALAPQFSEGPDDGYPVVLARFFSPTAFAAALLELHTAGQLTPLTAGPRAAFWAHLQGHLEGRTLPGAFDRRAWQRASLLAELADAVAGGDVYTWACWLGKAGWEQITPSLDAVFGADTPAPAGGPAGSPVGGAEGPSQVCGYVTAYGAANCSAGWTAARRKNSTVPDYEQALPPFPLPSTR